MKWTALAYSLPAKSSSTLRVNFWRRLRHLGAIAPIAGMYLLPAQPECVEAFHWLVQEIVQAGGEALACIVEQFHGMSEQELIELFNRAREKDYGEIAAQLHEIERSLANVAPQAAMPFKEAVNKLRRQHAEISRIDFFYAPSRTAVIELLTQVEARLSPEKRSEDEIGRKNIADYLDKQWVTRPRPYVDRLACIWLIRRFIDPQAAVRYAEKPRSNEIAFDMSTSEFGHHGNLCTFEMMVRSFRLDDPSLQKIAEIVHEIDLRDGKTVHPETIGIDALLQGWLMTLATDQELESYGTALFEALYTTFAARL